MDVPSKLAIDRLSSTDLSLLDFRNALARRLQTGLRERMKPVSHLDRLKKGFVSWRAAPELVSGPEEVEARYARALEHEMALFAGRLLRAAKQQAQRLRSGR